MWAEPCKHWKLDPLNFELVEDDRYFDERNGKLYKKPCVCCGDLLVHGKKAYDKVMDELKNIAAKQSDFTATIEAAVDMKDVDCAAAGVKGKPIWMLVWFKLPI